MIRVRRQDLRPGDVLAEPLVNPQHPDHVLLPRGYRLTERMVSLLGQVRARSVWTRPPGAVDMPAPFSTGLEEAHHALLARARETVKLVREERLPEGGLLEYREAMAQYIALLRQDMPCFVLIDDFECNDADALPVAGAVMDLALLTALALHERLHPNATVEERMADYVLLGIAALFHEIGRVTLEPALLQKDEWDRTQKDLDQFRTYPMASYRFLRGQIGSRGAAAALYHRLYFDGTGFPSGVAMTTGGSPLPEEPTPQGRVLCAAHAYVELVLRRGYLASEALEEINCIRGAQFDPDVLSALNRVTPVFPPGEMLTLASGHSGVVSRFAPEMPFRPTVILLWDKDGELLPENQRLELSLSEYPNTRIARAAGRPVAHLVPLLPGAQWEELE